MRSDDPEVEQKFRVRLEGANGEPLMVSENYATASWALESAIKLAGELDANLIDET